jgi:CheY-like chemotaxis protein
MMPGVPGMEAAMKMQNAPHRHPPAIFIRDSD